jgi:hypothetical protein
MIILRINTKTLRARRDVMKNNFLWGLLVAFSLIFMCTAKSESILAADRDVLNASIMRPDMSTMKEWIDVYEKAPKALIDKKIILRLNQKRSLGLTTSMNLPIAYEPDARNQGSCGNCWVWAATGIVEISNTVTNNIADRLSIQYLNSCKSDSDACCGGSLSNFVSWYNNQTRFIPWTNTNASFSDGFIGCGGLTNVSCGSISTYPGYSMVSMTAEFIQTYTVDQTTAINNIKNILNQNRGVFFSFTLGQQTDWDKFFDFWLNQPESTLWDPDNYCGGLYIDPTVDPQNGGGSHAVLIFGYNDDDPDPSKHYWIVLNSWGTAGGKRPNGVFRMPMVMNYGCKLHDDQNRDFISKRFQTLSVCWNALITPTTGSFDASGGNGTVNVKSQIGCGWTAVSNDPWITIVSGGQGTGGGSVTYSVAANSGSSRIGIITVAGNVFTVNQAAPTINVTAPNSADNWEPGTPLSITWAYVGNPGSDVKIELLKGGTVKSVITQSTSVGSGGTGSFSWTIPCNLSPGNDYKIRVTSVSNPSFTDDSDYNFSVGAKGAITVTYPKGGETLESGKLYDITWTYTGDPGSAVRIELVGLQYWMYRKNTVLADSVSIGNAGNGSHSCYILAPKPPYMPRYIPPSGYYRIKVTSTANACYTDLSDTFFIHGTPIIRQLPK